MTPSALGLGGFSAQVFHRLSMIMALAVLSLGCGQGAGSPESAEARSMKVAYLGLTCEAPIFVAMERGYFRDEGVEVELVRTDWDGLRDGLGLGRFDANHTLIMYLLKPIEQGLDVKISGGVHTGCLRIQAGVESGIQAVEDLRGKRVGVPTHLGSPPFLFASRVLAAQGLNPRNDVDWVVLAPDVLELALKNGQVDAVTTSEPIGSILLARNVVRTIADQATDPPYDEEYCCAVVVSGKLARQNPEGAAKLTRAMLRGAKWVGENPTAAAALSVEKKYISASTEVNAQAISQLKYLPSVQKCRESITLAAQEMKAARLLNPSTDPVALSQQAWVDLEGVDDAWAESLEVDRVAGGGSPPPLTGETLDELIAEMRIANTFCCDGCCLGLEASLCLP